MSRTSLIRDSYRLADSCLEEGSLNQKKLELVLQGITKLPSTKSAEFLKLFYKAIRSRLESLTVVVESVLDLDSDTQNAIKESFGKNRNYDFSVNKDLVGGLRVRMGDNVLDGSISRKLQELK